MNIIDISMVHLKIEEREQLIDEQTNKKKRKLKLKLRKKKFNRRSSAEL